jgi:hypothetical protein
MTLFINPGASPLNPRAVFVQPVAGHFEGHALSALALNYRASGSPRWTKLIR